MPCRSRSSTSICTRHYSLLDSAIKPDELMRQVARLGDAGGGPDRSRQPLRGVRVLQRGAEGRRAPGARLRGVRGAGKSHGALGQPVRVAEAVSPPRAPGREPARVGQPDAAGDHGLPRRFLPPAAHRQGAPRGARGGRDRAFGVSLGRGRVEAARRRREGRRQGGRGVPRDPRAGRLLPRGAGARPRGRADGPGGVVRLAGRRGSRSSQPTTATSTCARTSRRTAC